MNNMFSQHGLMPPMHVRRAARAAWRPHHPGCLSTGELGDECGDECTLTCCRLPGPWMARQHLSAYPPQQAQVQSRPPLALLVASAVRCPVMAHAV